MNYVQFAPDTKDNVVEGVETLYKLIYKATSEKTLNPEDVSKAQYDYNDAVRRAHAEILNLPSS